MTRTTLKLVYVVAHSNGSARHPAERLYAYIAQAQSDLQRPSIAGLDQWVHHSFYLVFNPFFSRRRHCLLYGSIWKGIVVTLHVNTLLFLALSHSRVASTRLHLASVISHTPRWPYDSIYISTDGIFTDCTYRLCLPTGGIYSHQLSTNFYLPTSCQRLCSFHVYVATCPQCPDRLTSG